MSVPKKNGAITFGRTHRSAPYGNNRNINDDDNGNDNDDDNSAHI
jgi:hypothetical protein